MGYNCVQPIQVTTPSWLIHLCPARGLGRLIVKERDLEAGHWVVVAKYEGTPEQMLRQFHVELYRRNIIIEGGLCNEE